MWLHHILLIVCLWWSLPCTFIGLEKLPFIQVLMALRKSFFKTYYRASGRCCWSAKTRVQKQKYGIEKKQLPISAQCLIDSRICVLRPCSRRTLYTFIVRAGSWDLGMQRKSLSWCIWPPVCVARPKPRLIVSGPTMQALWFWCSCDSDVDTRIFHKESSPVAQPVTNLLPIPRQDYTHRVMLNDCVSVCWSPIISTWLSHILEIVTLWLQGTVVSCKPWGTKTDRRLFFSLLYFRFCTSVSVFPFLYFRFHTCISVLQHFLLAPYYMLKLLASISMFYCRNSSHWTWSIGWNHDFFLPAVSLILATRYCPHTS